MGDLITFEGNGAELKFMSVSERTRRTWKGERMARRKPPVRMSVGVAALACAVARLPGVTAAAADSAPAGGPAGCNAWVKQQTLVWYKVTDGLAPYPSFQSNGSVFNEGACLDSVMFPLEWERWVEARYECWQPEHRPGWTHCDWKPFRGEYRYFRELTNGTFINDNHIGWAS
jgi:hypothetical protein